MIHRELEYFSVSQKTMRSQHCLICQLVPVKGDTD